MTRRTHREQIALTLDRVRAAQLFLRRICPLFLAALLGTACRPVCILYPRHQEAVTVASVPNEIRIQFARNCPGAEIRKVNKEFGGKDGQQLLCWVFTFEQQGKLKCALFRGGTGKPFLFDVHEDVPETKK